MENNQMNQFFTEQPNNQPNQQTQQQQQFVQPEQINNFNPQTQFQEVPMQQFNNQMNAHTSLPNDVRISPKVFKIALIGSTTALVGAVISLVLAIITFSISRGLYAPKDYKHSMEAILFYAILGVVIGIVFTSLTVLLRKMKSKAPAVVMIVFSSIFLAIWGLGLLLFPYMANDIHSGYSGVTVSRIVAQQPSLGTLLLIANCSIIPGIISIGGWITLLVSGIMGVKISPEELKMNRYL